MLNPNVVIAAVNVSGDGKAKQSHRGVKSIARDQIKNTNRGMTITENIDKENTTKKF
ncbi:hypothetical protein AGMMS49990_06380 [Endomicrobiia bacterium]|nr:hypothetical protein AGMMS49990_06380 [Endomicrobiia bacterium]